MRKFIDFFKKSGLYNKWFLILFIATIVFGIVFNLELKTPLWKVITLFLFVLSYSAYYVKIQHKSKVTIFPRLTEYLWLGLMWLFVVIYLASLFKDPLVIPLILFIPVILIVAILIPYLQVFYKTNRLVSRIIGYLGTSGLLIILFGYTFTVSAGFTGNSLAHGSSIEKTTIYENVYYSASIFFSCGLGDYVPVGRVMRITTLIEALISIGIHIFLIAEIYSRSRIESGSFKGVIIEESLEDKSILRRLVILEKKIEKVAQKHKTPWIKQWTLDTVQVTDNAAWEIAQDISKSLDSKHAWYADFKNEHVHYIIFKNKVFIINRSNIEQYDQAMKYGLSLGIPSYQVDFSPNVKEWKR